LAPDGEHRGERDQDHALRRPRLGPLHSPGRHDELLAEESVLGEELLLAPLPSELIEKPAEPEAAQPKLYGPASQDIGLEPLLGIVANRNGKYSVLCRQSACPRIALPRRLFRVRKII
jgi:hypothetical protein